MKYQNTKTKVIIDVSSKIHGDNWIDLEDISKENTNDELKSKDKNQNNESETDNVPNNITKEQIMKELDAFGTKYNPADKKQVLYDLMMKGK